MQNEPLVSCLCLSYKRPGFLKTAVENFIAQAYGNKELIVVGHDDDELSKKIVESYNYQNIKYFAAPKMSRGALRNWSIERSSGEYFCRWDDDDWHHCKRLEVQYRQMEENGKLASLLISYLVYDKINGQACLTAPRLDGRSILCNRNIYDLGLKYDSADTNEDAALLMGLHAANCLFPVLAPSLYTYIYHGANTTTRAWFNLLFHQGQKLSAFATGVIKEAVSGNVPNNKSSLQLSSPNLMAEFNFLRFSATVQSNSIDGNYSHYFNRLEDKVVLNGPFKGLKYPDFEAAGSTIIPKLVGSYEHELESIMYEIINNDYPVIINIGCGEGYYANGLAMKCAHSTVYAYDSDATARHICAGMARLNGVAGRVHIRELCTMEILRDFKFPGRSLILCDCEGFEAQLFSKANLSNLSHSDLLIETHDFFDITISTRLSELFSDTHQLTVISSIDDNQKAKTYSFYPFEDIKDLKEKKFLYKEQRPCTMEWLWLRAGKKGVNSKQQMVTLSNLQ